MAYLLCFDMIESFKNHSCVQNQEQQSFLSSAMKSPFANVVGTFAAQHMISATRKQITWQSKASAFPTERKKSHSDGKIGLCHEIEGRIDTSIYQIIIDELVVCAGEANAKQKYNWSKNERCKLFCSELDGTQ